jgi:hypothetical protein
MILRPNFTIVNARNVFVVISIGWRVRVGNVACDTINLNRTASILFSSYSREPLFL